MDRRSNVEASVQETAATVQSTAVSIAADNDNDIDPFRSEPEFLHTKDTDAKERALAMVNTFTIDRLRARHVPEEILGLLENGDTDSLFKKSTDLVYEITRGLIKAGLSAVETAAVIGTTGYAGCEHIRNLPSSKQWVSIRTFVNNAVKDLHNRAIRAAATARGMPTWASTYDDAGCCPRPDVRNVEIALRAMGIGAKLDLFRQRVLLTRNGKEHELFESSTEYLTDRMEDRINKWILDNWQWDPGDQLLHRGIRMIATQNAYDPVVSYLDEREGLWDGKYRLERCAVDIFHAEDTPLNCAIIKTMLIASVRRARFPGAKFDNICVLESPEGWIKSTAIRTLYGDEFFSDQHMPLGKSDREAQELLAGIWGYECADLSGLKRADVEQVKNFASRVNDIARPAYGRNVEHQPRRCVLWATTNDSEYLQSQTGNRRFWPVRLTAPIDIEALKKVRDQLWSEAALAERQEFRYRDYGEAARDAIEHGMPTPEVLIDVNIETYLWEAASEVQEERRARDPWEDRLADLPEILKDPLTGQETVLLHIGEDWSMTDEEEKALPDDAVYPPLAYKVSAATLLSSVLHIPIERQTAPIAKRLAVVMGKLGWRRTRGRKEFIDGKSVSGFHLPLKMKAGSPEHEAALKAIAAADRV